MIHFADVNPINKNTENLIFKELKKIITTKSFILGKNTEIFEKKFSKFENYKYGIGCSSGTDALILALRSLNLKENDEIIMPGLSYISTLYSALLVSQKFNIKFVDIDINTGLIDINKLKNKISKKTKVIIVVNLYGQKINLKKLGVLKKKYNFKIIEDSAQCQGTSANKQKKQLSDLCCYSFYPSKNLGAYGDAGFICTNNKRLYSYIKKFRTVGSIKKNIHSQLGSNSRIDNLQSSVLNIKLNYLNNFNKERKNIAKIYHENLTNIKNIKLMKFDNNSVYHLYLIRVKNRNKFINYMNKKKIECGCHYPYTLYKKYDPSLKLINSETLSKECVSLPIYPGLNKQKIKKIILAIKKFK